MCRQTFLAMAVVGVVWGCAGVPVLSAAQKDEADLLAKARLEVAVKGFESAETVRELCVWSDRILASELSLCHCIDDRIAALEKQLKRAEKLEKTVIDGLRQQNYTVGELREVEFFRLDTRCKLAEEKASKSLLAK